MAEKVSPFPHLFSPIKVGTLTLKNRIAAAPTARGDCDPDGTPNDQNICAGVSLAKGGVGWVIVEHTLVTDKYGSGMARLPGFYSDRQLPGWRQLAEALHALEVAAVVQLSPGLGRWASRRYSVEVVSASEERGLVPVGSAPRGLKSTEGGRSPKPRALTTAEVEELEEFFATAAKRVKKAGFDGVEIHGAHGYLLAQFLSPSSNKRQDRYGGSPEKRMTLALNLIQKTRQAVGGDFTLGFRISGDEHSEGGYTLEDAQGMVPKLIEAGLDYIHLSSGSHSAKKWLFPPKEGVMVEEAAAIKKVSSVPVVCPNIHLPQTGERVIAEGKADVISLSRSLISDPEWPNKAREGRVKDIVKCTFCNTCIDYISKDFGVRCPRNPRVGWERFSPEYWPTPLRVPAVKDSR